MRRSLSCDLQQDGDIVDRNGRTTASSVLIREGQDESSDGLAGTNSENQCPAARTRVRVEGQAVIVCHNLTPGK